MTNQEAFDKVWNHFIVQNHGQSINPVSGFCKYRSGDPDSPCCAVGVLIPDDLYETNMENKGVRFLMGIDAVKSLFSGVDLQLLRDMQIAHDGHSRQWRKSFEEALRYIATQWKLTIPGESA